MIPATATDKLSFQNALGQSFNVPIEGYIEFEYQNATHRLTAMSNDEESYFIVFADQTTGAETYGGGRFLYPHKADEQGKVILDFNRAINPPCVFTPYATCPLPAEENKLSFEVLAGEKYFELY